jgi:hypothetical protein
MSSTPNTSAKATKGRNSGSNGGQNSVVAPLQVLLAKGTIGLMSDLTSAEKRVAIAIIDHFNRRTGRCDPSLERLAAILDINVKTVKEAVKKLDELQIILKKSFAGKYHCNAYQPNWHLLQTMDEDWRKVMRDGASERSAAEGEVNAEGKRSKTGSNEAHEIVVKTPRTTSPIDPFEGGEMTPQTNVSNQFEEPEDTGTHSHANVGKTLAIAGKENRAGELRNFVQAAKTFRGCGSQDRANAARASAEKRWYNAVAERGPAFLEVVTAISTDEHINRATEEEVKRRGGGVKYFEEIIHSLR